MNYFPFLFGRFNYCCLVIVRCDATMMSDTNPPNEENFLPYIKKKGNQAFVEIRKGVKIKFVKCCEILSISYCAVFD